MTTAGARIGFGSAAAAVAAGSVLLLAPAASAASAPVCGPAVPITEANTAASPAALTVPQFSGGVPASVSITIVPTTHYANQFFNTSTFSIGPGDADLAYSGAAVVLQASGPGLGTLADVSSGTAFTGGPGSFAHGTAQPALPAGVAAAEAVGAAGTSTASSAPADWTALGYPFTPNATVPASASGTLTYGTTAAGNVSAAGLAAYAGSGSVNLTAIEDAQLSTAADSTSGHYAGGSADTTTVQACATYTAAAPADALPETPRALLLPLTGLALGGGVFFFRRRRRAA